jgi:valyl-tRNA synthetase
MEDYQFGEAERQIHDFIWGEFCDWYIELAKIRLRQEDSPSPIPVLVHVLETSLRLLHPFMPFITEEIWQNLVYRQSDNEGKPSSIMVAPYPEADDRLYPETERIMESIIEIVRGIRNARTQYDVKASAFIEAQIYADDKSAVELQFAAISTLARTRPLTIFDRKERKEGDDKALVLVLRDADVVLPLGGMVDLDDEMRRLKKEIETCRNRIDNLRLRLSNEDFLSKSPSFVVEKERGKLSESQGMMEKLEERLKELERV